MNDYVFIVSESGARTNICSDFKLISMQMLLQYIQEDLKTIKENEGKEWRERKRTHILENFSKSIRVGKIDSNEFQTRILKYITLDEFEIIFEGHIDEIKPLLEYETYGNKYFRMDILKKYGIKKER